MGHWSLFRESFGKLLHPVLWAFGLLAALSGGFDYRLNLNGARPFTDLPPGARALLGDWLAANTPAVIAAGVMISVVLLIFGTFGQAALISLINRSENGERLSLGLGIDDGGRRFLHLLAVKFLLALPLLIIGALVAGSVLAAFSGLFAQSEAEQLFSFGDMNRLLGLAGLALVLSVLIGGAGVGAERAVVIEEQPIFASIGLGFKLLFTHLVDFIIIGVLFIVVAVALGLIFACALIPLMLTSASFGTGLSGELSLQADITGPTAIFALLVGLIFGTLGTIFNTSVWTLAYRQWRAPYVVRRAARPDELAAA